MEKNGSVISTSGLTIGYASGTRTNILFESLDLSLHRGEMVCFMGPNGIGKSSLIRTLAGAQKQLAGTVDGVSNKSVAVVLTDKVLPGSMRVKELITYGRYPYLNWSIRLNEEDSRIIDDAINKVNIRHLVDRQVYELSDGQLQMAMIARALAQDTPVLLLDEPTAHLDLNNRVEIMNLLRSLAKDSNKALLVSTHELDLALQTADLVWLATNRKSIVTGIPEDLVLDGTFDEVFKFKGFDLKTGRVGHLAYRKTKVGLEGSGSTFLWTKNALERCGYEISPHSTIVVTLSGNERLEWEIRREGGFKVVSSLRALLLELERPA